MAIKLAGIISGMDTDMMIDELVSAYSIKKDNIYKEQQTLKYTQDAWKALNTKVYSFYTGSLSSLRMTSSYRLKTSNVSDEKIASVTAGSTSVNGTQELQVTALAKSGYLTGAKLGDDVTLNTKLADMGLTDAGKFTVTVDGKDTDISVDSNTSIANIVSQLKSAGVAANYDEVNKRFFVSSINSGVDADFSITATGETGTKILKGLGLNVVSDKEISTYQSFIDAAAADANYLTNEAKVDYLNNLLAEKIKEYNTANSNLTKKISEARDGITFAGYTDEKKTTAIEDLEKRIAEETDKLAETEVDSEARKTSQATLDEYNAQLARYKAIQEEVGASDAEDFADKLKTYTDKQETIITGYEETQKANTEQITAIGEAQTGNIEAKETYLGSEGFSYASEGFQTYVAEYEARLEYAKTMVGKYDAYQTAIKKGDAEEIAKLEAELGLTADSEGAVRINGADAEIYLNGARFESTTNSFSVNGLTISVKALTEPGTTTSITTSTDTDGIYNMIKDFFTNYNTLIKEMESKYNAESAGDYEPLTDEEKEDLSDTQIEKWEKKLEDAALRRDSTLSSVISLLKTSLSGSVEIDGEVLSLSSFGIKTLGYFAAGENEKGMYHIDGDSTDSSTSGNEDKLRQAIASDPERVMNFFSKLTSSVYDSLTKKMASSTISSAYTLYNDKSMQKTYDNYDDEIDDWEDKVEAMREKYEQQFAAMETALSTLTSQQSQLSSLLGQ